MIYSFIIFIFILLFILLFIRLLLILNLHTWIILFYIWLLLITNIIWLDSLFLLVWIFFFWNKKVINNFPLFLTILRIKQPNSGGYDWFLFIGIISLLLFFLWFIHLILWFIIVHSCYSFFMLLLYIWHDFLLKL